MGAEPVNIDVETEALDGVVLRLRHRAVEARQVSERIADPPYVPTAAPRDAVVADALGSGVSGGPAAEDSAGRGSTAGDAACAESGDGDAGEVAAALRRCAESVADAVAVWADALDDRADAAVAAGRALAESDASVARGFAAVEDGLR